MKYDKRTYRLLGENKDLIPFSVKVKETDLFIKATKNFSKKVERFVKKYRADLERYILRNKDFLTSLTPLPDDDSAPLIVKEMLRYAKMVGVGPMAGVAGAIAFFVGKELLPYADEFIIENGGDIALFIIKERIIYIYPGEASPFKEKLFLKLSPYNKIYGIATSSGKIGPSLSFGSTDSVTVLSPSPILSDMVATKLGNMVKTPNDIHYAINEGKKIKNVEGILITIGNKMGMWGNINLL